MLQLNQLLKSICASLILLISCSNSNRQVDSFQIKKNINCKTINIDLTTENDIIPEKVIESISFVKLETTKNCFISNIHQLELWNDRFYILDQFNILYIFSLDGKYINRIKSFGKGPGEYTDITFFRIFGDQLIIVDTHSLKILEFSLDGSFIKEKWLRFNFRDFEVKGDLFYFYNDNRPQGSDKYKSKLLCLDKEFNLIKSYFDYDKHIELRNKNFYTFNGNIRFMHGMDNYIYEIDSATLIPVYNLNFGKHNYNKEIPFTTDLLKKEDFRNSNIATFPSFFIEDNKFLFFKFDRGAYKSLIYYDKTKNAYNQIYKCTSDNILSKLIRTIPKSIFRNKFVGVLYADDIIKYNKLNDSSLHNKFIQLKQDMDMNDNPVIVFYTINTNDKWY